jgi:hypothetical protein
LPIGVQSASLLVLAALVGSAPFDTPVTVEVRRRR